MLMRRSMIDDVGVIFLEDILNPRRIPYGADEHEQMIRAELRIFHAKLLLYVIGVILIYVKDDKKLRLMRDDLPAKLRAYSAASARDKHRLSLYIVKDRIIIDLHGIAAEQVCHIHLPELRYRDVAVHELIYAGQYLKIAFRLLADIEDLL